MHVRLIHAEKFWKCIGPNDEVNLAFARFYAESAILQLRYAVELLVVALSALAGCKAKTASLGDIRQSIRRIKDGGVDIPIGFTAMLPIPPDREAQEKLGSLYGKSAHYRRWFLFRSQEHYISIDRLEKAHIHCGDALHIGGYEKFSDGYCPRLLNDDEFTFYWSCLNNVAQGHFLSSKDEELTLLYMKKPGVKYEYEVLHSDEILVIMGKGGVAGEAIAQDIARILGKV